MAALGLVLLAVVAVPRTALRHLADALAVHRQEVAYTGFTLLASAAMGILIGVWAS